MLEIKLHNILSIFNHGVRKIHHENAIQQHLVISNQRLIGGHSARGVGFRYPE
jgi:hypothetical protein